MFIGFIAVPGAAFGQFFGGYLVHRFKLKVPQMIKFNIGCSTLVMVVAAAFWIKCEQNNIAGVTTGYDGT